MTVIYLCAGSMAWIIICLACANWFARKRGERAFREEAKNYGMSGE